MAIHSNAQSVHSDSPLFKWGIFEVRRERPGHGYSGPLGLNLARVCFHSLHSSMARLFVSDLDKVGSCRISIQAPWPSDESRDMRQTSVELIIAQQSC